MTFHIPAVDPALPPLPEMLTASFSAPGLFPPAPPARHEVPEHGSWLQTASGRAFDLLNPSPADVDFDDISLALSRVPRFGGHTRRPYSVAQHSVLVAELLESAGHPGHVVLQGLLHDATEAYVMDLPRPLKDLVGAPSGKLRLLAKGLNKRAKADLAAHAHALACLSEGMFRSVLDVPGTDTASPG